MNGPEVRRDPETGNVAIHLLDGYIHGDWLRVTMVNEQVQLRALEDEDVKDWIKLEEAS
jgi:hypothetical protein